MKKQAVRFFAMATLLITLSVGSSYADTVRLEVRANIPFDFVVGTKTLPQGTYTMKLDNMLPNVLVIYGQDNNEGALALSITALEKDIQDSSPKLVFNRYGDQYFLTQVWSGARLDGLTILKSRREREHLAKSSLEAKGSLEAEVVSIAAL